MTNEKAARILDPKTTLKVYSETEYYGGFEGEKRWKEAVDEACIIGVFLIIGMKLNNLI